MNHQRKIADSIRQLSGTFEKDNVEVYVCTVDSVDTTNNTCSVTVVSGEADIQIPNVLLSSEPNDGFILFPSVGSTVIIGLTTRNLPFVLMFEDIDSMQVTVNNTKFILKDGNIQMNDGSYGGLTKTQELQTQINKTNAVLQAVVNIISGTVIDEPGSGAPSALQAALKTAITGLSLGNFSNIENTLITHGQ